MRVVTFDECDIGFHAYEIKRELLELNMDGRDRNVMNTNLPIW